MTTKVIESTTRVLSDSNTRIFCIYQNINHLGFDRFTQPSYVPRNKFYLDLEAENLPHTFLVFSNSILITLFKISVTATNFLT